MALKALIKELAVNHQLSDQQFYWCLENIDKLYLKFRLKYNKCKVQKLAEKYRSMFLKNFRYISQENIKKYMEAP